MPSTHFSFAINFKTPTALSGFIHAGLPSLSTKKNINQLSNIFRKCKLKQQESSQSWWQWESVVSITIDSTIQARKISWQSSLSTSILLKN
jgi:hypothetical protein